MEKRFTASGLYTVQYFKANYARTLLLSHNEILILLL